MTGAVAVGVAPPGMPAPAIHVTAADESTPQPRSGAPAQHCTFAATSTGRPPIAVPAVVHERKDEKRRRRRSTKESAAAQNMHKQKEKQKGRDERPNLVEEELAAHRQMSQKLGYGAVASRLFENTFFAPASSNRIPGPRSRSAPLYASAIVPQPQAQPQPQPQPSLPQQQPQRPQEKPRGRRNSLSSAPQHVAATHASAAAHVAATRRASSSAAKGRTASRLRKKPATQQRSSSVAAAVAAVMVSADVKTMSSPGKIADLLDAASACELDKEYAEAERLQLEVLKLRRQDVGSSHHSVWVRLLLSTPPPP